MDSVLVKHAFSDNSNLFSIARTSEESKVLGILADIRIIFSFITVVGSDPEYLTRVTPPPSVA